MSSAVVTERNQIGVLQNFVQQVGWGGSAPETHADSSPRKSQEPGFEDWEVILRNSNAANDELCSQNGRLRAEIERLRAEEEEADGSADPSANNEDPKAEELISSVLAAVADVLSAAREASTEAAAPDEPQAASRESSAADLNDITSTDAPAPDENALTSGEPLVSEEHQATSIETPALGESQAASTEEEPVVTEEDPAASNDFLAPSASQAAFSEDPALDEKHMASSKAQALDDNQAASTEAPTTSRSDEGHESFGVSGNTGWHSEALASIEGAVRMAFREETESSTPLPALTQEEEITVLVGERVALRELVERQRERLRGLEQELNGMESAQSGVGALNSIAQGLSEAHGQISASLKEALAPKDQKKAAVVGVEYEIIGKRGTIVRNGESLRSDQVADLPPGSRVRVLSVSEKYPRRVEIICVRPPGSPPGTASPEKAGDVEPAARASSMETGSDMSPGAAIRPSHAAGEDGLEAAAPGAVVGWISASSKDGRELIRQAPTIVDAGGSGNVSELEGQEEGNEEIACVTLSAEEWQALHRDGEASMRRVEALTSKLHKMGSELLQSFEMKSVLGELESAVQRATDRCKREAEILAMTSEEVDQCRAMGLAALQDSVEASNSATDSSDNQPLHVAGEADAPNAAGADGGSSPSSPSRAEADAGDRIESVEAVDWDRLMSERETTSAALSAGLQRLATLEREVEELEREHEAAEGHGRGELGGLRNALRRLAKPTMSAMSKVFTAASPSTRAAAEAAAADSEAASAAATGLFRSRVEDLQTTIAELQAELRTANSSERALRRSIRARKKALRWLLHQGATSDLRLPQCGPLKLPFNADAERKALHVAVEEQLHCNLHLCNNYGLQDRRPLGRVPKLE